jgi:hypothetical protein
MTSAREHRQQPGGWLKDRGEAPLPVVSEQEEASVGQGVVSPTEGQGTCSLHAGTAAGAFPKHLICCRYVGLTTFSSVAVP